MKVGVIGTGHMGENHVRTYLSLQDHCQFVGIYDHDEKRSCQIAEKYNVSQFQSLEALLQKVDAVSVAVPTEFHYDIGLTCIKYNVHMLMEKPITSTIVQAKDLNQKAINAGVKLQVGHIELYNPLITFLIKELEHSDIIGIEFHRMSPYSDRIKRVDVVKDLMIHDLYILQKIFSEKLLEFYALGKMIENTSKHAAVMIELPEGVIAQLTASFKSKRKLRTIQVLTEEALYEIDILRNEIKITRDKDIQTIHMVHDTNPLSIQLLDFINCIQQEKEPYVSGKDGIRTLLITNKIIETINSHKA